MHGMSQIIISNKTVNSLRGFPHNYCLRVSEFFCDTIQGEGVHLGQPAAFLRLQGCTLNCSFCDTKEIWKNGSWYSFGQLCDLMEKPGIDLITKFKNGQHLVITGGSPLLQQHQLVLFIEYFINRYGFKPYIEIENECMVMPTIGIASLVDCWNNSPKLSNSGQKNLRETYQPHIVSATAGIDNSWFKFVIKDRKDWEEIEEDYLKERIIDKSQVILMPMADNREDLLKNEPFVLSLAIEKNVRYSTRYQILLWDKQKSV